MPASASWTSGHNQTSLVLLDCLFPLQRPGEGVGVFRPRDVRVTAASPTGDNRLVGPSLQRDAHVKMRRALTCGSNNVGVS